MLFIAYENESENVPVRTSIWNNKASDEIHLFPAKGTAESCFGVCANLSGIQPGTSKKSFWI